MAREDEVETRLNELIQRMMRDFADLGEGTRWAVTRALIHRAVHLAADGPGVEFCALASYLGDMIGHAHKLKHGDNPKATTHSDLVH